MEAVIDERVTRLGVHRHPADAVKWLSEDVVELSNRQEVDKRVFRWDDRDKVWRLDI
jgi:hypothetical protein